jgi:exonuclease VII small subunit
VVLLAFFIGLGVSIAGVIVATIQAVRLWRQTKRTGGMFSRELSSFEERAAQTERHLAEWERSNARLDVALERLRASRARLQVLQGALAHAQGRVRWLRAFLPLA